MKTQVKRISVVSLAVSESIHQRVIFLRGKRVMMDKDLAALYGVPTKVLNQAVRRNLKRFPDDFMFRLTKEELRIVDEFYVQIQRSQIVTFDKKEFRFSQRKTSWTYRPYAFTEQGIAMLSSVLRSSRAIQVNIAIMRIFVRIREMLNENRDLGLKINTMERAFEVRFRKNESQIKNIFEAIRQLLEPVKNLQPVPAKEPLGFYPRR